MFAINYVNGNGNQTEAIEAVMRIAKEINRKRKQRILFLSDVEDLMDAIDSHPGAKTIRRYSKHGFVANAYKWRAEIAYCQATKKDDGSWDISVANTDAKRSYGSGSLLTVDSRYVGHTILYDISRNI